MIRQAISCDICGAEKKQTNHWFVAHVQAGELRIGGWNVQGKLRAGSKHLCGQTCLHKLVDEFIAGVARGTQPSAPNGVAVDASLATGDISLTSPAAYPGSEVPARAVPSPAFPRGPMKITGPVVVPSVRVGDDAGAPIPTPIDAGTPSYGSRRWRAEAWKRERERELRAMEPRNGIAARRNNP